MSTATLLAKAQSLGVPYISTYYLSNNKYYTELNTEYWQALQFEQGVALDRLTYGEDSWRGEKTGEFIVTAKQNISKLPELANRPKTSIITQIQYITNNVQQHRPKLYEQLLPILQFLEKKLLPIHDTLPTSFSHGDPHPLNILWQKTDIQTVIDWEFSGTKCELYDPALIIGCVGSDDPTNFKKGFIKSFLKKLNESNIYQSLEYLPAYIVAVRFAWLSEWLRRDDQEMIENELSYMQWLIVNLSS